LLLTFVLTGTVLYAYYEAFPLPKGAITKGDQILPYFVVHELPSPLPGVLIAAIFGATMAVASAGINALATTVLVDFGGARQEAGPSERRRVAVARALTFGFGVLITLIALGLGQTDKSLIDNIFIIQGLFGGPSLGVFFLGVLSRRANGSGALVGAGVGAVAGCLIAFSKQLFGYPIAGLWVAFGAAAVTYFVGLAASLFFPAPTPEQRALVYGSGVKTMPPTRSEEP